MKYSTISLWAVLALAVAQVSAEDVDVDSEIEAGFVAYNRGDVVAAMTHYETAANAGSADAMARLGWVLDQSELNEDAVKWYRASAEQGHGAGYFGLGEMYAKGEGVDKDEAVAVENFTLAAEKGHAQATRVLINAYENGLFGLAADAEKVAYWQRQLEARNGQGED